VEGGAFRFLQFVYARDEVPEDFKHLFKGRESASNIALSLAPTGAHRCVKWARLPCANTLRASRERNCAGWHKD
jgi:hypothetical protein